MKTRQLMELYFGGTLEKILSEQDMKGKTKLKIARLFTRLQPEIEAIEKVRKGLVDKYGEDGAVTEENRGKFMEEWNEIQEEEVDVGQKITLSEIPDCISAKDIVNLMSIIIFKDSGEDDGKKNPIPRNKPNKRAR